MVKLTRDEKQARKALTKEFDTKLKDASLKDGWKYLKPTPFGRVGDWFVTFGPQVSTEVIRATIDSAVKPFEIDELVSQVMGYGSLEGTPLSLRARGPHVLVLPRHIVSIEREGDAAAMVDAAVAAMQETRKRLQTYTIDDFIETSRDRPSGQIGVDTVAALILAGRLQEAKSLAEEAVERRQWGGPARITSDGQMIGFFQFALRYIDATN